MRRRLVRWLVRWSGRALLLAAVAGYLTVNFSSHDPLLSHADPATVERSATPNDFLAAPPGTTRAVPDIATKVYQKSRGELMGSFIKNALSEPRVEMFNFPPDAEYVNLVQRSAVIGFPDYIAVRAVQVEGGSALIVYSRSRYGHGDLGVNRARVEAWLAALE